MKTITFTYTKADGKQTNRVLMSYTEPNKFFEGTDVSELSDIAQVEFALKMDEAHKEYLDKITQIRNEFDLNHSYRRFYPENMTNIVVEHL